MEITDINKIRPGDLIRLKGRLKNSHHVLMVIEVKGEISKNVFRIKSFKYTHSHRNYEEKNGVRIGEVIVINPSKGLKEQNWTEYYNGKNWTYDGLVKDYEDNGVRRLNFFSTIIKSSPYKELS